MEFQVYILQSLTTNRYYVGQTNNLEKRIEEHNSEQAGHTKKEQPWKLVWYKSVFTRSEALLLERKIKKRGAARFLEDLSRTQHG